MFVNDIYIYYPILFGDLDFKALRSEQKEGLQAKLETEANEAQRLQDKWLPQ